VAGCVFFFPGSFYLMVMVIWDQEWAETVAFGAVVLKVNNSVLPKRRVSSDRHTRFLTQLGLPAAAHSNISSDKLGGFAFFPDRPLQK